MYVVTSVGETEFVIDWVEVPLNAIVQFSVSEVITPAPKPVPSLKLASLVPNMFHLAALGCSPNTTDQLA